MRSLLLALILPAPLAAQNSFPMITHTHPVAVQRGRATEVTVEGQQNFAGAYRMLVEGHGLSAELGKTPAGKPPIRSVKMNVTVSADAALGVREFRLATPIGMSSIGQIVIVDEPVIVESTANNTPAQASSIVLPCVVCGRVEIAEDVDCFKFTARAGQALTFEVIAARLEDKIHDLQKHLDPLIALLDAEGREVAASDDALFSDPLLTYVVPKDGTYTLVVRDAKYDGDPRWVYAVRVTDRPYASHAFPLAGNPGATLDVQPVGSARLAQATIPVKLPSAPGVHEIPLMAAGQATNPVAFLVTDKPTVMEREPNDTPARATRVPVPCAANGRIGARRDVDHFVFKAVKGKTLRLEIKARRFGTPLHSDLDSMLEILSPTGQVLASNDDETGKDAGLTFTPPADGDFMARVRDLNSKGGEGSVYCLEIGEARPDFSLRCDPGKAMIGPGSSQPWYFNVTRTNGFAGAIDVIVDGLPPGVTASALTIPASMTQGVVVLTAAPGARVDASIVKVIGRAAIGGAIVDRRAVVAEEIYLPGGGRGRFDASMHAVAITEPSDILRVAVSPSKITLKPGEEVKLDVTITRRADYTKDVTLDILLRHLGQVHGNPLPPGVTMVEGKSKTLIGAGNSGHIVLKAAANAAPIENVPVCVLANVSVNFVVKISYASVVLPLSVGK